MAKSSKPDYWYLGTPYSLYPHGLEAAFVLAIETRALLIRHGIRCFSPIVHSHPVAMHCGLDPRDLTIWLPTEEAMLAHACGLIVLKADGWEDSKGLAHEIRLFHDTNRPVIFMTPGSDRLFS